MRQFVNASKGHTNKTRERWEQVRLISYYSAFPHLKKGFKLSDVIIPGDEAAHKSKPQQPNKEEVYKLLEKWNK